MPADFLIFQNYLTKIEKHSLIFIHRVRLHEKLAVKHQKFRKRSHRHQAKETATISCSIAIFDVQRKDTMDKSKFCSEKLQIQILKIRRIFEISYQMREQQFSRGMNSFADLCHEVMHHKEAEALPSNGK